MNIEELLNFAKENEISEETMKMLFKEALTLAAKNQFWEYDNFIFDIDRGEYYEVLMDKVEKGKIQNLGAKFLKINVKLNLLNLLNKTYPEKFKEVIEVEKRIKNYYEGYEREIFSKKWELKTETTAHLDGSYCSACIQTPCMCSDREQTSSLSDF